MKIARLIVSVATGDGVTPSDVAWRVDEALRSRGTQEDIHWSTVEIKSTPSGWRQSDEWKAKREASRQKNIAAKRAALPRNAGGTNSHDH